MSAIDDKSCEFEGKEIAEGESVCSSSACMKCRDGKLEESSGISVL